MTPEAAEYHRIMLLMGDADEFYREFDKALETEDPLSELVLSLCDCISDMKKSCLALREYTLEHPFNAEQVCQRITNKMLDRYLRGEITRSEMVRQLYDLVMRLNRCGMKPWSELCAMGYAQELFEDGIICEEAFNECFDAWYFQGEHLDIWQVQSRWYRARNGEVKRR